MKTKKVKMPNFIQGCHGLKVLFKIKAKNLTIYPEDIRMTECYIYCNEIDEETIRKIIHEFKEKYYERN